LPWGFGEEVAVERANVAFQQAAVGPGFVRKWLPTSAWCRAIRQTAKEDFSNGSIARAINDLLDAPESKFTAGEEREHEIFHNTQHEMRPPKIERTKQPKP
jgi:hypothetical protein